MFVRVMNTSLKYITKIQLAPNSKHYLAKKSSKFKNSIFPTEITGSIFERS